jgi:alcohol dehydrogenase/propanol-preferring alcohol dehydrogenase
VIDFVGSEPSSALALASLRKGGKLIVVGMYGGELRFPLPFLPMQARTIEGNYVGSLQDMEELMALVREGRIPPVAIDSRQPDEAGAILAGLKAGQIRGRAVLSYEG